MEIGDDKRKDSQGDLSGEYVAIFYEINLVYQVPADSEGEE